MERIEKAKQYISNLFQNELDPQYTYHDHDHSLLVLESVCQIAQKSNVSEDDLLVLQLAALFHDSGYIYGAKDHEVRSQEIADKYLSKEGFSEELISKVNLCIAATKMGVVTDNPLALILQDADMSGLGNKKYPVIAEKLRRELNSTTVNKIGEKEWLSGNLNFLNDCKYNTPAAKELYDARKAKNLKKLRKKQLKLEKEKQLPSLSISVNKSAQTQFKTALRNHIDLSNIADNKANIMISVNALILTVALPFLIDKAMDNHHFWLPTTLLAIVCLLSMIFATLATRPIKLKGITTTSEIKNNTSNLFFFGNYHKMEYVDYKNGVSHLLRDPDALDDSIIRDLFFLGKSLGGKFSYLRLCYTIFMYGIIVTVFTLMIVYFY
ncbi:MAG: putative metal-dependent HD superfamily phosphohydrolase [Saprospiraceae bacterium]|jgi:predicted metal-dependent HD superfamily phosphohydrolase|tara:strand:+ start:1226 stop:2368 length:1143 start_codon:yes stop_codon:yes gene_type:complete